MSPRILFHGFVALALAAGLVGCQTGPRQLKVASTHYSDAVRIAGAEQLLANIVRLRYRDSTAFLTVSNISTQFELDAAIDAEGDIATPGPDLFGIGAGIRYAERPTISFSILGGETFQKRILRPLPASVIALLTESGWRPDRVLRLTVEGINGVKNAPTASGPTPSRAPKHRDFLEVTALIQKLRRERLIDFEYELRRKPVSAPLPGSAVDGEDTVLAAKAGAEFALLDDGHMQLFVKGRRLVMRLAEEAEGSPDVARLRELLRLQAGRRRYDVVEMSDSEYDPFDPSQRLTEIGIDTRSLVGVLYYISNGVSVAPEELEAGLVTATVDAADQPFDWSTILGELFRVHSSEGWRRPGNAAVAVQHRGRWFYIADDDQTTKSTFQLIDQLFTLQAGDIQETKPVLTLPVGG